MSTDTYIRIIDRLTTIMVALENECGNLREKNRHLEKVLLDQAFPDSQQIGMPETMERVDE